MSALQIITAVAAVLGGLAGVSALIRVFLDYRTSRKTLEASEQASTISAEELELRKETTFLTEYRNLLDAQRQTMDDYQEATNARLAQFADDLMTGRTEISELKIEVADLKGRIVVLTIDRDTLIQHIVEGRGLPLPDLRTI